MKVVNFTYIDYLKATASFFVTAVHFRDRVERLIPEIIINDKHTIFFSLNYSVFITAVPIFLLVTGFLSNNSKDNKKYYLKILNVYLMYLFLALFTYNLMVFFDVRDSIPFFEQLLMAMKFELISGWYIELYVGIAILAPLIVQLLNGVNKEVHQKLIVLLLLVTCIPSFVNKNIYLSEYIYLPNYYSNLYPFVYFVIGNYIRKYDFNFKNVWFWLSNIIVSILVITYIIYVSANPYTYTADGYYSSILEIWLSVSIFMFYKTYGRFRRNKIISFISKNTLSTYIVSLPVDRILYPIFIEWAGGPVSLIKYCSIVVIVSFVCALILGYVLSVIYRFLKFLIRSFFLLLSGKGYINE